jgi:hypothetical protein
VGPFTPYLWSLVKPFLDPRTAEKVVLLTGGSQPPDLAQYIPETSTPLRWLPKTLKHNYTEPEIIPPLEMVQEEEEPEEEEQVSDPLSSNDRAAGGGGGGGKIVPRKLLRFNSKSRGKGSFRCSCINCARDVAPHAAPTSVSHASHMSTSSTQAVKASTVVTNHKNQSASQQPAPPPPPLPPSPSSSLRSNGKELDNMERIKQSALFSNVFMIFLVFSSLTLAYFTMKLIQEGVCSSPQTSLLAVNWCFMIAKGM